MTYIIEYNRIIISSVACSQMLSHKYILSNILEGIIGEDTRLWGVKEK